MAENFQITEEMQALVGWESAPWDFEVTATSVRAFARGVGYTDLVYYDVEAAKAAGYRDLPAPPSYLGTAIFIPGQSDEYLPFPPGYQPPLEHGLSGLLDGGTETEYFEDICAGDTLTCVNKLAGLATKESKGLGTMLIMSAEATYTNQEGKVAAIQRAQVILY
ncbi:MaoC family dehydratase N-terminal domain-containing protein [Desulfatibacillum aliphaticivorans]|uniref:MaoC family dehydratase N-terminal domain-containing protein n=1 Tax=Desulfatibacillum aliphaticivorans TaxID=218208 RepID=UPI0003F91D34|nr:MaoC family dehydratase N-terminal domain-containing protein [Desulfatibacillum aliphaticivorans]